MNENDLKTTLIEIRISNAPGDEIPGLSTHGDGLLHRKWKDSPVRPERAPEFRTPLQWSLRPLVPWSLQQSLLEGTQPRTRTSRFLLLSKLTHAEPRQMKQKMCC